MKNKGMKNLFVYGTLMKGGHIHDFLKDSKFLGYGRTVYEYCMYDMYLFPIVTCDKVSFIHGEVYRVDFDTLKTTDVLEGSDFTRIKVNTLCYDKGILSAWMYVSHSDISGFPCVRSGNWKDVA